MPSQWWKNQKPLLTFDDNGQSSKRIYVRLRKDVMVYDYAIVTFSDDGEVLEVIQLTKKGFKKS